MPNESLFGCPFCGDNEFDAAALKDHLESGDCSVYETIPNVGFTRFFSEPSEPR
jgi:hypothetical protein